jgi:hypothetical protein
MGIKPRTREETIRHAKREFSGWTYGDTIYYKVVRSKREMMDTIIHEYVHWKRKKLGVYRYKTPMQKLREETIATYLAEKFTGKNPSLPDVLKRTWIKYSCFSK